MTYSFSDQEILKLFPYPSFRKGQDKVILKINQSFNSGIKCILMSVPTGIGKSGINIAFSRAIAAQDGQSFYTTPQNQLIDQIKNDPFLGKYVLEIKGRNNYECIKDYSGRSTVDIGACTRFKNYIPTYCNHIVECPYWKQKHECIEFETVLTNPIYLCLEGKIPDPSPPKLGIREHLTVDEGHFIEDTILQTATIEVRPFNIGKLEIPTITNKDKLTDFLVSVKMRLDREVMDLEAERDLRGEIPIAAVRLANTYREVIGKIQIYLETRADEWIWEVKFHDVKSLNGQVTKWPYLQVTPLHAKKFGNILWGKVTDSVIISSATILDHFNFIEQTGLSYKFKRDEIMYLECPAIFPKENRPIIDMSGTVGSLSMSNGEETRMKNLEQAALVLNQILDWEDGNVVIHLTSYKLQEEILEKFRTLKLTKHWNRFITHDSSNRHEQMDSWTEGHGGVFFAVAFREGHDWKGEKCDAQVLFKVPYPDIGDKRQARLLALGFRKQYFSKTLINLIQAYGRAVRSETDKKRFYIVDGSFWSLIRSVGVRNIPEWFYEVVPKYKGDVK